MKRPLLSILCIATLIPAYAIAPTSRRRDAHLELLVADTGPGLCTVTTIPSEDGPKYIVYDTGHWKGKTAFQRLSSKIPKDAVVDWLILSHSDADHLAATDELFKWCKIKRVVFGTMERDTDTWENANEAIEKAVAAGKTTRFTAEDPEVAPGKTYPVGDASLTFVCGFNNPPDEWKLAKSSGEYKNAGSVVVRVDYSGKSILFTGDAVGRLIGHDEEECIATEKFMVDNQATASIDCDVLLAPHHGADNGSSKAFIKAVSPKYVIFSAGHDHEHPTKSAARRYTKAGIRLKNMYRTDLRDDEPPKKPGKPMYEWKYKRKKNHVDPVGDDDVTVRIKDGAIGIEQGPP